MSEIDDELKELMQPSHHRAEIVFAVVSFLVAGFLATQWSTQTTWVEGQAWGRQPGLWPLIAIGGMLVFGIGELVACILRNMRHGGGDVLDELGLWLKAAEYALWFMAYVLITPYLGYLPATLIFTTVLAVRLGYRGFMLWLAPLTGLGIVVVFKTLLSVRIPGGAIYEYLPGALRNLFIVYL